MVSAGDGGGFESFERVVSEKKKRANRLNAQKSTGPRTEEGKKRSSLNAITHGIFCQDVLLPGEDEVRFACLHQSYISDLSPQTVFELSLVGQIVAAQWRILRCQRAEGLSLQSVGDSIQEDCRRSYKRLMSKLHMLEEEVHDDAMFNGEDAERDDLHQILKLRAMDLGMDIDLPPEMHLATAFVEPKNAIDRFSRYEQRQQQTIQRCLRELERMRGKARAGWNDLPPSPFCAKVEMPEDVEEEDEDTVGADDVANAQNEPTEVTPAAGDGPAEGCEKSADSADSLPLPGNPGRGQGRGASDVTSGEEPPDGSSPSP